MKEKSCMIVVPENEEDIWIEKVLARLENSNDIKMTGELKKKKNEEDDDIPGVAMTLSIDGREYKIALAVLHVEIPEFFRTVHAFSDLDFQKIEKIQVDMCVEMEYSKDFLTSYHDQLRIINLLVPGHLAVMDMPSEKVISGRWVKLAAESQVPPAPRYLFTVQAISGDGDEVWLHSHGLKRCGLPELEILGSNKDMFNTHYSVIESMAVRMIENEEALQPYEPMFLAWLTEDIAMVTTVVDWREGLKHYPDVELGKAEDRDEYHSQDTEAVMLYLHEDDVDAKKVERVQFLDKYLGHNTMFMVSNEETNRMRKLAQERIEYVKTIMDLKDPDVHVLLKIGLQVDKEFIDPESDPETQKEHIWFELKEIKKKLLKEVFVCELTQKPYYVKKMDEGSIGKYTVSDVTDWIIFTKERRYTPDDAYMLNL